MLSLLTRPRVRLKGRDRLAVEIISVATAVPKHKHSQTDAAVRALKISPHFQRLDGLVTNTGIEWRYSCVPADWCHEQHGWQERSELFQRHALDLLEEVATKAIASAGLVPADIDMLVVNTITGLAVPSLDALLLNRVPFSETVERLPIFGFGCGGGVGGLARTARLAAGRPGAVALFLTVELSSLCARPNDRSIAGFVSGALFADGAAAVVLRSAEGEGGVPTGRPAIVAIGEKCWRKTEKVLGYEILDDCFGMVLSPELPALMRSNLAPAIHGFLEQSGMKLEDIEGFLIHPGGRKILETAGDALGIAQSDLAHSWGVLRDFGNMSSAAILFVLERALASGDKGRQLLAAFGPGFAAYFIVAEF